VEKSIYRYIIRYSMRRQVVLTIMATASFPFLYAFYELPKLIVNSAIQGKDTTFPTSVSQIQFDQVEYLWLLCGLFLGLVIINQAFKYVINVYAGITGERMLRRLRFDLYGRVLRFPLPQFRKTSSSEIVTMVTAEVEPLGGFIGDAFKLPIFQGGYLIVILAFLFVQNWYMALAAVALYPLQGYLIPKLQRRVNLLGKERVRLVRQLSDRIGETVAGVQEIHAHNTARRERADFSHRLGAIYEVRLQIYIWKFIVKFLNNTINQLGPFSFYAIGGYLAIKGELEIGTLMAAIAAHKDLAAPWKELLNFYQRQADAKIKYEQVMEQFQPVGLAEESRQLDEPDAIAPLSGEISASNLSLIDDTGAALVEGASFMVDAAEHVAIIGGGGSGKDETTQMLARLLSPTAGTLRLGGQAADTLPEAVTGRRLAYVGSSAYMFSTTVRDNLLYGVKHLPLRDAEYDDETRQATEKWRVEAIAAGNSTDDINADWIDYDAADAPDDHALLLRILETLTMVTLDGDIYQLGLRGSIDPATQPGLAEQFLKARAEFHTRLTDPEIAALVEGFDPEKYNDNATLGENLLFGTPIGSGFDMDRLAENTYVIDLLEREGLIDVLLDTGQQIASTMTELFADLPPGHPFFEQFSFISAEDLPEYQAILTRINRDGIATLRPEERTMLLSLPFKVSPARHRLGVIDDDLQQRILKTRKAFAANLPEEFRGMVEFFDVNGYNAVASLQDNILFGKLAYGQARGGERVGEIIAQVIDDLDLRATVMEVGLSFHVGNGGGRLSSAQRQKLGIARAILKRPDVLILNEATGSLDGATQTAILAGLKQEFDGRGLIWAVHRPSMASDFDRALVMKSGRVIEQGTFEELNREGTALHDLVQAE
jgi:ABC-type multidrug transport system fused ATPase/permease subunit